MDSSVVGGNGTHNVANGPPSPPEPFNVHCNGQNDIYANSCISGLIQSKYNLNYPFKFLFFQQFLMKSAVLKAAACFNLEIKTKQMLLRFSSTGKR